jgi:ribosomal protein L37AE/L43A
MTDKHKNPPSAAGRERRSGESRRTFFRGGRRKADWPASMTEPLHCPRCASAEVKLVDGTPETLFWECHPCRHAWSTAPDGRLLD